MNNMNNINNMNNMNNMTNMTNMNNRYKLLLRDCIDYRCTSISCRGTMTSMMLEASSSLLKISSKNTRFCTRETPDEWMFIVAKCGEIVQNHLYMRIFQQAMVF